MRPNFNEEKKLWKKGYKYVACLDEAGRGPLAGPVTAAAVIVCRKSKFQISLTGDSKKIAPAKREIIFRVLTKHPDIEWGVGIVSEKIIDKINILEATKLAMIRALRRLEKKLKNRGLVDFLVLDGKMSLNLPIPQKSIVKADEKVFSCAAASILAKVTRDRIMTLFHKKYPRYGFDLHKGYPTKYHREMLKKYGPCKIHRKSFTSAAIEKNSPICYT